MDFPREGGLESGRCNGIIFVNEVVSFTDNERYLGFKSFCFNALCSYCLSDNHCVYLNAESGVDFDICSFNNSFQFF